MTQELTVQQNGGLTSYALPLADIKAQVNLIQHVMKEVMKENEHYGIIPGCGTKPTLLKSGAEKLIMTFRLSNDLNVNIAELLNGHRDYRAKCTLYSPTGNRLGTAEGSCSTMEGKYRFRNGSYICPTCGLTDTVIKGHAQYGGGWVCYKKKGGCGATFKDGDKSIEGQTVGKIEHDNPADYYNTCLKMATKRAVVAAVLITTAASDIFTQDIEDMPEVIPGARVAEKKPEIETKKPEIIPQTKEQGFEIENLLATSDLSKLSKEWQDFLRNDLSRLDNKTATDVIATLRSLPAKSVQEEKA